MNNVSLYYHDFRKYKLNFCVDCLTVKNQWELLTGDDGVGIMKIVTMVNGKDVLWSTYTLRITNSENFIRLTRQQMRAFRRGRGGGTLVTYFTALSHWSST